MRELVSGTLNIATTMAREVIGPKGLNIDFLSDHIVKLTSKYV